MKLSSRLVIMAMLELSLFAVRDHQAPVLYVWRMEEPVFRVIGKVESKRSEGSELRSAPWKRTAIEPKQTTSSQGPLSGPIVSGPVEYSSQMEQVPGPLGNNGRLRLEQASGRMDRGRPSRLEQEKREITLEDILMDEHTPIRITTSDQTEVKPTPSKGQEHKSTELTWPAGTYGIPRSASGCPWSEGFYWKIGFRFHDTEDDGTENQHSESFHLAGKVSDDGIRHEFCMKTNPIGQGRWPEGKYCIYKIGPHCPAGLEAGFIIWDDENKDNKNSAGGTLPEGHYDEDTKIEFCCSGTGDWDETIRLPRDRPFYLYAYESNKCQKVEGMRSASEFIKFDDEDRGNIDYQGGEYPYGIHKQEKDHTLFLCYYTPIGKTTKATNENKLRPHAVFKQFKPPATQKVDKLEEMEKLRNSAKMMDAFLQSTAPRTDETDKSERTKTIIKTIRVSERVKDSTASIIATTMGIVLGAILIGAVIMLIVARRTRNRHDPAQHDTLEEPTLTFTNSSRRSSFATSATSDDEIDLTEGEYEDELVEDQYLPSDSELKSGLELMFLKQQRHYWTRDKRP